MTLNEVQLICDIVELVISLLGIGLICFVAWEREIDAQIECAKVYYREAYRKATRPQWDP